jgi:PKD repeat protein
LTISCPPVSLSPPLLPSATLGLAYAQTITSLGIHGPYTFAVTGGTLPAGLMLSPSGSLSGSPTTAGTFSFTVTVTDANGCATDQNYTLAVCRALSVSPEALPAAIVGAPFTATIVASGGTAPFSYAQTGLPSTITLDPTTGVISGTPTAAGVVNVTVVATDANGCTGGRTNILRICPLLALSPSTLEGGEVGVPYSATTIVASGGTAPHTYTSTGLPGGLGLSPAGVLSGIPTAAGAFTVTVTATDANGCAVSRSYTIVVTDAPPRISDLTLSPSPAGGFTLLVVGSGFVDGAMVVVNGVSYPATFVSPTLLTVSLPASAIPTTGSITVTVKNPGSTGGTSNPASLTFCDPPGAPVNPTVEAFGNPTGPVTATDFLLVRWQAPAAGPAPSSYEFRINGDPYTMVVGGTSAVAPPRGANDPITLHVRAHCNADVAGPETASPTYSLAPPAADFTFSGARVGVPVLFTDTSSPQATSWFWIFDDGGTSTVQSPAHTFTTAGTHQVALIASNGSGSSQKIKDVPVSAASTASGATTTSLRSFETSDGRRWRLRNVKISTGRPAWLKVTSSEASEVVVYLRFVEGDGRVVLERRLSVAPGESAVNDVAAYGLEGTFTLEIVPDRAVSAVLEEPDKRLEGLGRHADEN